MTRRKRNEKLRAADQAEQAERAEAVLRQHLQQLGLTSVAAYKVWCRAHGFGRGTNKSHQQREQERLVIVRKTADARRTALRRQNRTADQATTLLLLGKLRPQEIHDPRLQTLHRVLKAGPCDQQTKQALEQILQHAHSCSRLFDNQAAIPQLGSQDGNTFVDGLAALALHQPAWCRPVEQWKPRSHNAQRQFASLSRHLFAQYDVPTFMDSAWFIGRSNQAQQRQQWFIHIAQGKNIRSAQLPIPYTKRMAHHFLKAPSHYSVNAALRWGQVHGLDGDARMADAVCATRLGEHFEHDDFWSTVLRFFIANPMLDTDYFGPIIDFLYDQRFRQRNVFVAPGIMEPRDPVQPNLSMTGRTPDSLLRQVHRWHRQLAKEADSKLQWVASDIRGFEFVEGTKASRNMRRWAIRELFSARALNEEGVRDAALRRLLRRILCATRNFHLVHDR